jgi:hypothetical protein
MISSFLLNANRDLCLTNLHELTLLDHTLHPESTVHRDMFIIWRSESIWHHHVHNFLREMTKALNTHIIEINIIFQFITSFIYFIYLLNEIINWVN